MSDHTCEAADGYSASWAGEWYSGEYPPRCKHCGRFMPAHGRDDMSGIDRIAYERDRQIMEEGYSRERDCDLYPRGELAMAAVCYAVDPQARMEGPFQRDGIPHLWPWDSHHWKPTPDNRIRELEKAGALIAAEIDRLLAGGA